MPRSPDWSLLAAFNPRSQTSSFISSLHHIFVVWWFVASLKLLGLREETVFLNVAKNTHVSNRYNFFPYANLLFCFVAAATPVLFHILILVDVMDSSWELD